MMPGGAKALAPAISAAKAATVAGILLNIMELYLRLDPKFFCGTEMVALLQILQHGTVLYKRGYEGPDLEKRLLVGIPSPLLVVI